jgi:hypothetical protein
MEGVISGEAMMLVGWLAAALFAAVLGALALRLVRPS